MAKAIAKKVTVIKGINLILTEDEAKTLQILFSKIGGSPHKGLRKHVDAMLYALRDAGIDYPGDYNLYFNLPSGVSTLFLSDKELPVKETEE